MVGAGEAWLYAVLGVLALRQSSKQSLKINQNSFTMAATVSGSDDCNPLMPKESASHIVKAV